MDVKVKICGIRNQSEIEILNRCLPDYAGFVFSESKRRISIDEAAEMTALLDRRVKPAGVFRNENIDFVTQVIKKLNLGIIQLHGSEDSEYIMILKRNISCEIWKAVSHTDLFSMNLPKEADKVLVDSDEPGSGKKYDMNILTRCLYKMSNIIIAGGLDPDNVEKIVRGYNPFCVDVSTGVEAGNQKDEALIKRFIEKAKGGQKNDR